MIGTVEIAGGGIAGLTTGLAFARKGWRVRVHEQDSRLRILGTGIYIWENGLRIAVKLAAETFRFVRPWPRARAERRNDFVRPEPDSGSKRHLRVLGIIG